MSQEAARLQGSWRDATPGSKNIVRFDVGLGRLYGFIAGHAFARELLIGEVAESDTGLVLQLLSDGKPVVATIGKGGGLRMEAGGKVFLFERLEG